MTVTVYTRRALLAFVAGFFAAILGSTAYWPYLGTAAFYGDDWLHLYRYGGQIELWQVWRFFSLDTWFFWRPLPQFLVGLQYAIFGLKPPGYLIVSLLLHAVATGMLALFTMVWTRSMPAAVVAAFIAATSWVGGDMVSWLSNQSGLLSSLLTWAALSAWVLFLREKHRRHWWVANALFAAALLCKQTSLAIIPALALLSISHQLAREDFDFGKWKMEGRRLIIPLLPAAALGVLFAGFSMFLVNDVAIDVRKGYQLASALDWPRQIGHATSHLVLSPIAGLPAITGAPGVNPIYLWTGVRIPIASLITFIAIFALRIPYARTASLLIIIFFFPIILFVNYHTARFYYLPMQALGVTLGAVAAWAITNRPRPMQVAAGLIVFAYGWFNWLNLWGLAAVDAGATRLYGNLYTLLHENRNALPERTVYIVPNTGDSPQFGLRELAKLATGDDTAEAVFHDSRFDEQYYRLLSEQIENAYHVRQTEDGEWVLVEADHEALFIPIDSQ